MEKMIRTLVIAGLLSSTFVQADHVDIQNDELDTSSPTVLFFSQKHCSHCTPAVQPFKDLASQFPDVTFAYIDLAKKNQGLQSKYEITGTPTFYYVQGDIKEPISSVEAIPATIAKYQSTSTEIDAQTTTQEMPASSTAAQSVDSAWAKIVAFFSMIYTKIGNVFMMIVEKVQSLFSK